MLHRQLQQLEASETSPVLGFLAKEGADEGFDGLLYAPTAWLGGGYQLHEALRQRFDERA